MILAESSSAGEASGKWVVQKDETVQARINEIDKTIAEHSALIASINAVVPEVDRGGYYISEAYSHATEAVKIADSNFIDNIGKINVLASNIKSASGALGGVIGLIGKKIDLLEQEKTLLKSKLYKKVWVPYS